MDDGTFTVDGSGVVLGAWPYILTAPPKGVVGSPMVRRDDRSIPLRSGVIPGDDLFGGRSIEFEVAVLGATPVAAEQRAVALEAAFAPRAEDVWLLGRLSGDPAEYAFRGRRRGADVAVDWILLGNDQATVPARCEFLATDPIRYSASESSVTVTLGSPGASYLPFELPVYLGDGGSSGEATAVNAGSASVSWVATLSGPLTNPRLTHVGSGASVGVMASIAAGETVVIDGVNLLFGGTSPRPSWLRPGSSPFLLDAGSNVLRLSADAGSGDASVTWRSGWI